MKKFQVTGQYEKQYFTTAAMRGADGRLHPLVTYIAMSLANNAALLIFLYMLFTQFTVIGTLTLTFLLLSSVMIYMTS